MTAPSHLLRSPTQQLDSTETTTRLLQADKQRSMDVLLQLKYQFSRQTSSITVEPTIAKSK